jgi:hypothetical protein
VIDFERVATHRVTQRESQNFATKMARITIPSVALQVQRNLPEEAVDDRHMANR